MERFEEEEGISAAQTPAATASEDEEDDEDEDAEDDEDDGDEDARQRKSTRPFFSMMLPHASCA